MRDFNKNRAYFFYFVNWISLSCLEIFYGIHQNFDMKNLKTFGGIHVTRKSKNWNLRYSAPVVGGIHETRKSNKLKPEVSAPGWARGPERRPERRPEGPAGCKASRSTRNPPLLMNTTTGFQVPTPKTREYRKFFVRVLLNTVHKK